MMFHHADLGIGLVSSRSAPLAAVLLVSVLRVSFFALSFVTRSFVTRSFVPLAFQKRPRAIISVWCSDASIRAARDLGRLSTQSATCGRMPAHTLRVMRAAEVTSRSRLLAGEWVKWPSRRIMPRKFVLACPPCRVRRDLVPFMSCVRLCVAPDLQRVSQCQHRRLSRSTRQT